MNLSKEEFEAWLDSPVTQAVKEFAASRRQAKREDWEEGVYVAPTLEAGLQLQATALGYCSAWKELQELTFDQLETELRDE